MLLRYRKRLMAPIVAVLLLGVAAFSGTQGLLAQDGTPTADQGGRPAHIHSGSCDDLGDVVQPLTNLTAPTGNTTGQDTAIPAEYSYTMVPMSLDDILADDYAINVHESTENIGNYIACGDLGGTVDANGQLVIGLRELNDSGFTGIAFLTANPNDASATDVTVFISPTQEGAADTDDAGTPGADTDTDDDTDAAATPAG